jgi:hypothetical protein
MSRRTGFLVTVLMVVMWSLAAGAADAASPLGATVGPGNRSAGWAGKVFVLGATQSPSLCPLPQDSNDILCDHFSLTVGVSPGYWSTHSGGIGVSIRWASSSDNFDLYLYDSSGSQVAASAAPSGTTEHVSLAKASGKYEVRVVPKLVKNSGYSGGASFSSQDLPPPSPKPKPPPPGGGGSGGSGGAGGAGSGNGFYQPGAYVPFGGGGYFGSGGTNSFGGSPSATTSRRVYYVGQGGTQAGARASNASQAFTAGRLSRLLWILVPIGLFLFAAAGLAVFHPDEERERRTGTVAVRQGVVGTVPPESLAGLTVSAVGLLWRAIAALARGLRHVSLWGWRRFRR